MKPQAYPMTFTKDEVNLIYKALGKEPYAAVRSLMINIETAVQKTNAAAVQADVIHRRAALSVARDLREGEQPAKEDAPATAPMPNGNAEAPETVQ